MSAGAAYGPGIYLAKDAATSFGYMGAGQGWANSMLGQTSSFACIALCEVVDHRNDSGSKVHVHGGIYVVEDDPLVTTRYFFIFSNSSFNGQSIDADKLKLPEDMYGK